MDRQQAKELLEQTIPNKNLQKHMLAAEACMKGLAEHFGEDQDKWALAGLLHDLDYDRTANDFPNHGLVTAQMLEGQDISEDIIYAIKAHPGHVEAKSKMDFALYAVDPLTGLIVAAALMHPTKKLANVDVPFIMKRYKEKRFAAGANRDQIQTCDRLGLSLEDFIGKCLTAMQGIAPELGL
ncbi:MAG: phosphohydrolase [Candidatus Edwardsbacteria bacterium RIFOXYD12_FULL_50_11]|uniref:Phosphohydrolase n=1 Tax=Candidatus Edwardsbacteria bacterium GWF2_54_11 TaxID=1817851 RepID=A0A1F5R7S9_9BACT|nr:MAG: phosphohydrolase [Candidatus Edwardsbacteria bacterium RifOxyC12_full_54_24]OGF07776.1 MAG: phosphohydrolase [Candidatus Edwardsbacteria bacterium RifOxyA12_full_54_48]OGF10024.1 MAG: phosphohydrolase [Candidatus Edwardsbacteria bacterium GWE2_54_12]OGF10507.1 MAG: phosphohydrolase [Candidatus Edwardsbacteria bacterium GWF2_54_11]OGF14936.1 MAG: phosphohydrolase [Candidatus Edwardsbacteria bacterium RIFOXYD12_FULL_50_11]OGJ19285.1 MAG: phosphohydrolase [Candidatus Edwardsbacteria bacte